MSFGIGEFRFERVIVFNENMSQLFKLIGGTS